MMRLRYAGMVAAAVSTAAIAWGVEVSSFGYDAADSTRFVQAALDSGDRLVMFDRGPLVVKPLTVRSNTRLVFAEGVELQAKPGEFMGVRDSLLDCGGATNVQIIGLGKRGGVVRMRKADYRKAPYAKSEWRHCLRFVDAQQVTVSNMAFIASGGDGICTGGTTRDVVIDSCVCDDNYRQGISVCAAANLLIRNCVLSNTRGTLPAAGIDFEPDRCSEPITNCRMENCRIVGNGGAGIDIYLVNQDQKSQPIGLTISNCIISNNYLGITTTISQKGARGTVSGRIDVMACIIANNASGPAEFGYKPSCFPLVWKDCVISNEQRRITFRPGNWEMPFADGISFDNLSVYAPIGYDGFEEIEHNLHAAIPTNITGCVTFVRNDSKRETLMLNEEWRKKVFAAPLCPNLPPRISPDFDGKDAVLVDGKPGEMVAMEPFEVLWGGRYAFFADKPGLVRLRIRQVAKEKGSTATDIGDVMVKRYIWNTKCVSKFPYPKLESQEVEIKVPERGFYYLITQNQYARFVVEAANVPVAFWCVGRAQMAFVSDGGEHELLLPVQGGKGHFALLAKAGDKSRFGMRVCDDGGAEVFHADIGGEWVPYISPDKLESGVWRIAVGRPKTGVRKYFSLDAIGSASMMFLSSEKYVTFR